MAERIRLWQWAFIVGLVACVLTSLFVFGPSLFLGVAGALTLLIALINALVSQPTVSGPKTNWLLSKLKNILNVGKFLKIATVIIYLATSGILAWACIEYKKRAYEAQLVTIEGIVMTAGGDPADKAVVTLLLSQGSQQAVTTNGRFTFVKIDLSNEPSKILKIQARLGTREAEQALDLSAGPPQGLVLHLSAGDPPFRVTYFLLEHQATDFLLRGKIENRWEEKLAGQPFIVPNSIYKTLTKYVESFSRPLVAGGFRFYKVENDQKSESEEAPADQYGINRLFDGSAQGGIIHVESLDAVSKFVQTLNDPNLRWKVYVDSSKHRPLPDQLVFRKYVDQNDLNLLPDKPISKFYQHITKEYLPPDFGYIEMASSGICEEEEPQYIYAKFVGRMLALRVAVIENITNAPIKFGRFTIRENNMERPRTRSDNKDLLNEQQPKDEVLFPMEYLRPGEKIVIPIEMPLIFEKDGFFDPNIQVPPNRQSWARAIGRKSLFTFLLHESSTGNTGSVDVDAASIEHFLNKTAELIALENEYVCGPSVGIDSIEVDNVKYPFRQFDPTKIIIYDEMIGGSCPYVYTYSNKSNSWVNEGVILYGRIGAHKISTDEKQLDRFDGRILLKEKDPEDSFIDMVYVRAISVDGSEEILYPRDRFLSSADDKYLKLRQGEQFLVDFESYKGRAAYKYILVVRGYYIPYRKVP